MECRGFTLIEILIVAGIIVILGGIMISSFLRSTQKAKTAIASAFIAELETAICMYKIDMGEYPPDEEGSISLKRALDPSPSDPVRNNPRWNGPYLEFRDREVNEWDELLDPWHKGKRDRVHIYSYSADFDCKTFTHPPYHNVSGFDIYCKGYDGKTGKGYYAGNYCQNEVDDDGDGVVDELNPGGRGASNGYLEDDVNNW